MSQSSSQKETVVHTASEQQLEVFIDAIWMERGLSENTLNAYRTDLYGFAKWLLSLIHISEPTRQLMSSRMPSSA